MKKITGISQNALKLIAAGSMLIDHIGAELFPQYPILRILGRLAFPIFSFCIYEGCRYTHDKLNYLLRMAAMGLLCVIGYLLFSGEIYGNVLLTFSLSMCIVFSMQYFRKKQSGSPINKAKGTCVCIGTIFAAYLASTLLAVDYGFCGVLLPAFAEAASYCIPQKLRRTKLGRYIPLFGFSLGTLILCMEKSGVQWYCLFALLLLFAYNGKRGKWRMKSFFYWFYPLHLIIIGIVSVLFFH